MGLSPVVVTGVIRRDQQQFKVDYEIRWFKLESQVWCKFCGPQSKELKTDEYDIADGTLRTQFNPKNYEIEPLDFESSDIEPVADMDGVFVYEREGYDTDHIEPNLVFQYQAGALFHLVLPPRHLPLLNFIEPEPSAFEK